jgi:hypothetical protein
MNEKHGAGGGEALRMIDLFESVGARRFDITFTDTDQNKRGFRAGQSLEEVRSSFRSTLLSSCDARGTNIIVRPQSIESVLLVQLDDLDGAAIERVKPVAFMTLATSPGNHQAWVAVEGWGADFARRLRKGAGADLTASGATRVAGTRNFKRKYEPDFPTVAIADAQPGRMVSAAQLDAMGLVAAPDTPRAAIPLRVSKSRRDRGKWPSYERCIQGAPLAHNSDKPDISRADFTWCMTAVDWGRSIEDIAARLMQVSAKAQENGEPYALLTAQRAASAVQRRPKERA